MTFSLGIPLCGDDDVMTLTNKRHIQLDSSMLAKYSAGNVTVTTKEGLPVFVNLNVFFSSRYLASLLDLPPCVSAGLIIPDADLATLNILVKLLTVLNSSKFSNFFCPSTKKIKSHVPKSKLTCRE